MSTTNIAKRLERPAHAGAPVVSILRACWRGAGVVFIAGVWSAAEWRLARTTPSGDIVARVKHIDANTWAWEVEFPHTAGGQGVKDGNFESSEEEALFQAEEAVSLGLAAYSPGVLLSTLPPLNERR